MEKEISKSIIDYLQKELEREPLRMQEWLNLKESCRRKGINYKTVCNKRYLQPNNGIPDAYVGGRKVWHRTTIEVWIKKTDEEMLKKGE